MTQVRSQDKVIKMYGFKEWWKEEGEELFSMLVNDVSYSDAYLIWQAATERAAKIAEEPGWKCEDVCPEDCTNAKYIAQKIRMD